MTEEQVLVIQGRGYDVHDGKRWEWATGDLVSIPATAEHQHFNADPARPARLVSAINRIYQHCGLNDLEQYENAPDYDPNVALTAELVAQYMRTPLKQPA